MIFPKLTAYYAGLFAIILIVLSARVVVGRGRHRVHHGDGGVDTLSRMIRAHANFTEYVPFALFLAALVEGSGVAAEKMHMLLIPLLVARVAHPIGMMAPVASTQQFTLRGVSALITWIVIAAEAVLLLMQSV
jgi:uncharacterized membrane protein YecN with MAPEG domain